MPGNAIHEVCIQVMNLAEDNTATEVSICLFRRHTRQKAKVSARLALVAVTIFTRSDTPNQTIAKGIVCYIRARNAPRLKDPFRCCLIDPLVIQTFDDE